MKKLLNLSALLLTVPLFAANVQVRDLLNTTVLPAANDYYMSDGVTNGTSKTLASNMVRKAPTRAALAALSVTSAVTGQAVQVLGGSTIGDGNGAVYYYDSASTAYPDGVNVIQPTVGSGRWLISRSASTGVFTNAISVHSVGSVDAFVSLNNSGGGGGGFTWNMRGNYADASLSFIGFSDWLNIDYNTGLTTFTRLQASSNANLRATKGSLNITVNVKDYGATGDGTTDDSAALNASRTALTNNSVWYFPPGKYRIASGIGDCSGLTNLTVRGEGAEIYNDTGSAGTNTMVFENSCRFIEVTGIRFTGSSSARGSGIHIRMYADDSYIHDNYFQGCSDFAILVGNTIGAYTRRATVANNIINGTRGDGIHIGEALDVAITGNVISNTGDDAIGIVSDAALPPQRVVVSGNQIYNSASRGIAVLEARDVLVVGNSIYQTEGAGIEVGRNVSTSFLNARIAVMNNQLYDCVRTPGPRGAMWISWVNQGSCSGNQVIDPANGYGLALLDISEFVVNGNYFRGSKTRGIGFLEGTTNVRTTWDQVYIQNNVIQYVLANEGMYLAAPSTVTVNGLVVSGNTSSSIVDGTWILYDRISKGRIFNNLNLDGASITAGGTVSGVTTGNNN